MTSRGGKGGDVVFKPGHGGKGNPAMGTEDGFDGDFVFMTADGTERMRIAHDGTFSVSGRPVEKDRSVYIAFKGWLEAAYGVTFGAGDGR